MILTVTPNTAIDWTILVQHFVWNETLRASQNVWGMGGKPADASWVLGELGFPTRAMGFSAGNRKKNGRTFASQGCKNRFCPGGW